MMKSVSIERVLITGVSGFIGSHLAERCVKEGIYVRGLCRKPDEASWLKAAGVDIFAGDLLNITELENALSSCEIVVHAAGWSGGWDVPSELAWRSNVEGTKNVIAAARKAKVKQLIYISSVAVYGVNTAPIINESMETPLTGELYPDSKIEAEKLIRASGVPYTIIRPGSIYGPRGKGWTIEILKQIQNSQLKLGNGNGKITPGYIDNFIDGLLLCMTNKSALGETFNLCDAQAMTYSEYYLKYAEMLGLASLPAHPYWKIAIAKSKLAPIIRKITGKPPVGCWTNHFRFNPSQYSIEHAKAVLGYQPKIDFNEGIKLTKQWWSSFSAGNK